MMFYFYSVPPYRKTYTDVLGSFVVTRTCLYFSPSSVLGWLLNYKGEVLNRKNIDSLSLHQDSFNQKVNLFCFVFSRKYRFCDLWVIREVFPNVA